MKSQDATQINTTISIAPQPHGSRSRGNARADAPGPAFFVLGSRPPRSAGSRAIEPAPPLSLRASVWCASAHGTRPRSPMPRVRRGQLLPWITPWAALARAAPPRDHPLGSTCKGCASVLRTCVPRSRAESGEKRSRKYLIECHGRSVEGQWKVNKRHGRSWKAIGRSHEGHGRPLEGQRKVMERHGRHQREEERGVHERLGEPKAIKGNQRQPKTINAQSEGNQWPIGST